MGPLLKALLQCVLRLFVVVMLILVGGIIFMTLENDSVENEIAKIMKEKVEHEKEIELQRKIFMQKFNTTINTTEFLDLAKKLQKLATRTKPNKWDMATGTHFAFTIASTIGYGVIVPTADPTRIMTIFYALFTIPLFLYLLSGTGDAQKMMMKKILQLIEIKLLKRTEIKRQCDKIIMLNVILFLFWILVASAAVYKDAKWSFFEAIYFWFITASTIGFGDYVLAFEGNNRVESGRGVIIMVFNILLLSGLSCLFSTIYDKIEENANRAGKERCFCLRNKKTESREASTNDLELQMSNVSKGNENGNFNGNEPVMDHVTPLEAKLQEDVFRKEVKS